MTTRDAFDTLAPTFQIRINGQDVPVAVQADLIAASIVDDVDAPGMITVTLSGWDGVKMETRWIDDPLFQEGNPVEVLIGYQKNIVSLFKGELTVLEPAFPEDESPTLTVRGHDKRHRLMRQRRTRTFTNIKDSEIADRIAGDAGLGSDVESTPATIPYVIQHNQTDLEFLLARAQRIGFEVVVDDRTLAFRSRGNAKKEVVTLRRNVELLEFMPRLSTIGQAEEVVVRGWNPAEKKAFVGRSKAADNPAGMGGSSTGPSTVGQRFGDGLSVTVETPVLTQEDADRIAKGIFSEMALGYITAEGTCIGDPQLRAGTVVKVDGVGKRFSGLYYLTSTEHRYSQRKGYRTTFIARRNAT